MFQVEREYKLSNGVSIPSIGYGTWKIDDAQEGVRAIGEAIQAGYRHLDSAAAYGNEESLGEAVRRSGVPREELFITGKVKPIDKGYEQTLAAFDRTLEKIGTDYLDLYLIHWPRTKDTGETYRGLNLETWRAFEELYRGGRVRAVGVSNFHESYLREFLGDPIRVKPMVNQIEVHPYYFETATIGLCRQHEILVSGYSPLMRGGALEDAVFVKMAAKYAKTPAQVVLRWSLQKGIIPLPKSVNRERMAANLDVYGFALSPEDMDILDALNSPDGKIGSHPDRTKF